MPILGALITSLASTFFAFMAGMVGAAWAVRITAALTLAGFYVASVVLFTSTITPWLASVFSTSYGALLGLLFPPIAGSVVAGMAIYYSAVTGRRYIGKLMTMAVG